MKILFSLWTLVFACTLAHANECAVLAKIEEKVLKEEVTKIYLALPSNLRPMICNIDDIYLSQKIKTTGFAKKTIGFRKSLFDQPPVSISYWASWKEQLSFGLPNVDGIALDPNLPRVELAYEGRQPSWFEFIFLHEVGHVVKRRGPNTNHKDFKFWRKSYRKSIASFVSAEGERIGPCFYRCSSKTPTLDPTNLDEIYSALKDSGLFTLYSSKSKAEAWADLFALYISSKYLGLKSYKLILPNGSEIDAIASLNSEKFKDLRIFLDKVIQNIGLA